MWSCDIKIGLRLSFFSRRKNLPGDVHLHNGLTDLYLLFITYHVAKDTSRSMNSEGTKKCFTIWKLLIIIQETLTIFGCEEVLEFLQEEIRASWWHHDAGKVSFEKLPVAAILLRQATSVLVFANDGSNSSTFFFFNLSDLTSSFIWRQQIVDCCFNSLKTENRIISGYLTACLRGWWKGVWEWESAESCAIIGSLASLWKEWRQVWWRWWEEEVGGGEVKLGKVFHPSKCCCLSLLSCFDQRAV